MRFSDKDNQRLSESSNDLSFSDTVFEKIPRLDAKLCFSCREDSTLLCKTNDGKWMHRCTKCKTERKY